VSTSTQIREELKAKRAEATQAWAVFEPLRDQIAAEGFKASSTEGKELVAKAHQASAAYQAIVEGMKDLENSYDQALAMDGLTPPSKSSPFDMDSKDSEYAEYLAAKTPGDRFVGDERYAEFQKNVHNGAFRFTVKGMTREEHIAGLQSRYAMKTLLQSGAPTQTSTNQGTLLVPPQRLPGFVELLQAPLKLRNLITVGATDSAQIEWLQQTAVASAAAEVAEATATSGTSGTKPESGMTFQLQNTPVQIIAHWIPTTRAALADMAQLRTIIDTQLVDGVARRLNTQILKGDGNAPNLKGILHQSGIQAQDDVVNGVTAARKIERIMAAITKIRLAFLEPTAVLLHPSDYQEIRLAKDAMGQYYFGPPSQAGEATIWGLPMIEDVTVDAGAPVVGDWAQATLYVREDVSITATDSHSDFFVRNMIAVLAEGRYALAVQRPDAFCTVDFSTAEKASTGWS
jgi:HK97 family phage major capsid protein